MISFKESIQLLGQNTEVLHCSQVKTEEAVGYLLQEDVISKIDMPPFDKSIRDGYSLLAEDSQAIGNKIKNIGFVSAGECFSGEMHKGECVKTMTGASLAKGADCVIMVEDTKEDKELGLVEILKKLEPGDNICSKAQDIKAGDIVVKKGTVLSVSNIAAIASVGKETVTVCSKPKVSLINTGGEIVSLGGALGANEIFNTNGPMLKAMIKEDGFELEHYDVVKDVEIEMQRSFEEGLTSDVLLISGGVSRGDFDLVPKVLKDLGVQVIFHRVSIKPGRPLYFGKKDKTLVFGLPGNPISGFLTYLIYARAAMLKMSGINNDSRVFKEGILGKTFVQKDATRRHFVLVKIEKKGMASYLHPSTNYESADIKTLSDADGFMEVEENVSVIDEGQRVKYFTWK
ncbi:MAG: molybdopterin molybdotransferase MoeA [Candidatus Omnitrophica bacterium]|nr:molybdopterin molybdotransferase MoeA [Candidatus Omnitrophota bacterium]MBU1995564.1 molybdopterin molybdotransferase MoeA [Candidatus Omnitrophota bacterium]MBU4334574.1 molybdopterin molybdotransferase MoeA [Candidatus Omnitrophota bacterium]